jgi:DNA gyrase subunit B
MSEPIEGIKTLSGREVVRKRPGMYLGDAADHIHVMCLEVLSNSYDQIAAGLCDEVILIFERDGFIIVRDNGPGMPDVQINDTPLLSYSLQQLHYSPSRLGHAPHDHLSMGGAGLFVIAAASSDFFMSTTDGRLRRDIKLECGEITQAEARYQETSASGTLVRFLPDQSCISNHVDRNRLEELFVDLRALFPGARFVLEDRRVLHFQSPLDLLSLLPNREPQTPVFSFHQTLDEVTLECHIDFFGDRFDTIQIGYVNWIRTKGAHVEGLEDAITEAIEQALSNDDKPRNTDALKRISYVCRVRLADPHYRSPTKEFLSHPTLRARTTEAICQPLTEWLRKLSYREFCWLSR